MPIGAFGIELPTDRVRVDTRGHLRALACLEDGLLHAGSRPGSSIGWGCALPLRTSIPIGHTSCTGAVTVTWAHRNRLMQTVYLVTQGESSIGPEPGTTYTVRIYGEAGTLKHTETGITGTGWTYPIATEITESGVNRPNEKLTVKIEAVRDGYTSWQSQEIAIPECRGYGMFYGATYGE